MVINVLKTLLLSIIKVTVMIRVALDNLKIVKSYTCGIKLILN